MKVERSSAVTFKESANSVASSSGTEDTGTGVAVSGGCKCRMDDGRRR